MDNFPTVYGPPFCELCGPSCKRVGDDTLCECCRKAIGGRRPDPDRREGRVWRVESRDPDEPDEPDNWHYVWETTRPELAKSNLAAVRSSHRAQNLGLVFRVRYSETRHYIEDW